jgi:hypothetical protein
MVRTGIGRRSRRCATTQLLRRTVESRSIYRMLASCGRAFAGVAGALYAGMIHYVSPDTYSPDHVSAPRDGHHVVDNIYGAALGAVL